jgi:hypothetical protein
MTDPPRDDDASADASTDSGLSRRTLIRLLVGFGLGIPILVEALTFLGLLEQQFGNGGDGDRGETPTEPGVGIGDDLLSETDRSETLVEAGLRRETDERWPFTMTVEVENTGETPYEFQLLAVHTASGRRVSGRTTTGRIPAGETETGRGEWLLPSGTTPAAVEVVALVYGEEVETIERRVALAKVPVRGR